MKTGRVWTFFVLFLVLFWGLRHLLNMIGGEGQLLPGCRQDEQIIYASTPSNGWQIGDDRKMQFFLSDPNSFYKLYLLVRHNNRMSNMAQVFKVSLESSDGFKEYQTIRLEFSRQPGKWDGKGVSLKQIAFPWKTGFRARHIALYRFSIAPLANAPKDTVVYGIENVGIRVVKMNN